MEVIRASLGHLCECVRCNKATAWGLGHFSRRHSRFKSVPGTGALQYFIFINTSITITTTTPVFPALKLLCPELPRIPSGNFKPLPDPVDRFSIILKPPYGSFRSVTAVAWPFQKLNGCNFKTAMTIPQRTQAGIRSGVAGM